MATYEFNQDVLDKLLKHDDDDLVDFAQDAITIFGNYAETVANFTDDVIAYRKENPETYRTLMTDLDTKRRMQHNACMSKIDGLNRIAEKELKTKPFCAMFGAKSTMFVNRTDLGDAILTWSYEHLNRVTTEQMIELGLTPIESNNSKDLTEFVKDEKDLSRDEKIMNDYNNLMRDNRYPMVKDDDHYKFIHFLTQQEVDSKMVTTYCYHQLEEKHKINRDNIMLLNEASHQVNQSNHNLSHHNTVNLSSSAEIVLE